MSRGRTISTATAAIGLHNDGSGHFRMNCAKVNNCTGITHGKLESLVRSYRTTIKQSRPCVGRAARCRVVVTPHVSPHNGCSSVYGNTRGIKKIIANIHSDCFTGAGI